MILFFGIFSSHEFFDKGMEGIGIRVIEEYCFDDEWPIQIISSGLFIMLSFILTIAVQLI